ncbi:MAG: DUF881 domain-containing protein [Actinomycetes bacterium]
MSSPSKVEPDASLSLLERLVDDAMDPGYQQNAKKADKRSVDWRHSVVFAAAIAITAALATAAVMQVRAGAPSDGRTRTELTERVVGANTVVEGLDVRLDELASEVERLRELALDGSSSDRALAEDAAALEREVGVASMTGPGVQITMADGPPAPVGDDGPDLARVLDTDIQLVVNGLFAAGADAVAVNGQRITALSPIRSAGQAVLVGFRPLTPPYVITGVGEESLTDDFQSGAARSELSQLEASYGINVDVAAQPEVTVPGRGELQLRYVKKGENP